MTSNGKIDIYSQDSISIHSENDLNFTAKRDINFTAGYNGPDAKTQSEGGNIHMNVSKGSIYATAEKNVEIKAGVDGKITVVNNMHIKSQNSFFTATANTNIKSTTNNNISAGADNNIKAGANNNMSAGSTANIKSGSNTNITAGADLNLKASARWMQAGSSYWSLPGGGGTSDVSATAGTAADASDAVEATPAYKTGRIPQTEPWSQHENLKPAQFKPEKTRAKPDGPEIVIPKYYKKYTTPTDTFKKGGS
jgi:uncharacterized protein (DUF2345 family)